MPTYEYHCEKGHTFEEFQSILADPVKVCPICGAHAERIISGGTGMIFKGSGFYITDYARKNASGSNLKSLKHTDTESAPTTETTVKPESEKKPPEKKDKTES